MIFVWCGWRNWRVWRFYRNGSGGHTLWFGPAYVATVRRAA